MAWFEVDIFNKSIEIDLHNYSTRTALEVAREKIKEAYEHGFRHVKLIHGAAGIKNKNEGGSVKFELRSMLRRGEFDKWTDRQGSESRDESLILVLRKNTTPVDGKWKEMPLEDY
jgi:hypothetical protein